MCPHTGNPDIFRLMISLESFTDSRLFGVCRDELFFSSPPSESGKNLPLQDQKSKSMKQLTNEGSRSGSQETWSFRVVSSEHATRGHGELEVVSCGWSSLRKQQEEDMPVVDSERLPLCK